MRRSGTLGASISANFPEIKYHWIKEGIIGGSEKESQVFHEIPTGRMVPLFVQCPGDIDRHIHPSLTAPSDIEAWKAQKYDEVRKWMGCGYEGSPISAAWQVWNDAHTTLIDATVALKVRPTTLAGLAAMLR